MEFIKGGMQTRMCSDLAYVSARCRNTTTNKTCHNGQVKLLDSNAVQLCKDGEWYALCSRTWSWPQAQVVCRQLGKNPKSMYNDFCCL